MFESWLIDVAAPAAPAVTSNETPVTPYMFVPVMTTAVPPDVDPCVGVIDVTVVVP